MAGIMCHVNEPVSDVAVPTADDQLEPRASQIEPRGDDPAIDDDQQPPTRRRKPDRGLLVASLVIAIGLVLIIFGFITAQTGDEGVDRPDAIESLTPVENAVQVLQQESVIVDLQFGYAATLTIDGVDLPTTTIGEIEVDPGEQIQFPPTAIFDAGNSVISYRPTEDGPIESFEAGVHRVTVTYWLVADGPETARSYSWTFNAV